MADIRKELAFRTATSFSFVSGNNQITLHGFETRSFFIQFTKTLPFLANCSCKEHEKRCGNKAQVHHEEERTHPRGEIKSKGTHAFIDEG